VAESLPPQCGGPDIVGWDWSTVDEEQSAGGTTWGVYSVVGTWDGERLTLTEPPGPAQDDEATSDDLSTPCDPAPGGWAVVDPATATEAGQQAALSYARGQNDFAGAWVDQSINPASQDDARDEEAMNDPTRLVLNLRFTGNLTRHEAEVRDVWGGWLCIVEAERPLAELLRVQEELPESLDVLSSSVDEVRGVVEVSVVVADDDLQQSLDDRYGTGVVEVTGALRPVR